MIPILVYDKDQCDPKKCTAKRMEKFGLAKEVPLNRIPPGCIVLSPFGKETLSPADLKYAHRGIVVLDLTWTHIDEIPHIRGEKARKLPYFVAANPVNWGNPGIGENAFKKLAESVPAAALGDCTLSVEFDQPSDSWVLRCTAGMPKSTMLLIR